MKRTSRTLFSVLICFLVLGCGSNADASTRKLATRVVVTNPTSLSFGSVPLGATSKQRITITNTGNSNVNLWQTNISGTGFSVSVLALPLTLTPNQSVSITVAFLPRKTGSTSGVLSITSNAANTPTAVALSGSGYSSAGAVSANPISLSFGTVSLGTTASQNVTLSNTGTASATISQASTTGTGFSVSGMTLPATLSPGQSATLTVSFLPYNTGSVTGALTIVSNATNSPATVALTGTGFSYAGVMGASPSSLNLGNVVVGSSGSQPLVLTNSGNATVTLSGVSSSAAQFTASGLSFPMSLNAGQSVSLTVNFTPTATGTVTGTVSVASNASNAPTSISVSGTGMASGTPPTVTTQPTSQTIIAGQTASFSVTASGTSPLSYQWQKNGTAISGATAASYTTPSETTADSGAQFTVVVSNSAGNVTSNPATLTVNAATFSLSANPTSLTFGNVNLGASSSLNTTVSNNGNSSVTISGVSVSGTGYTASGLSSGQVLAPGQSATLSVVFAPAAVGSVPGNVSIASNASNSPAMVGLAGSGVTSSSTGLPTCGKSGDTSNHVPADWSTFLPPAKGQSYVDPTFGCTVTRVTDASSQDWSGSFYLPLNMGYATVSPFNANDTYLMLSDGWRRYFVTDLTGNIVVPIANMPAMNNTWLLWDASDPSSFYYTYQNYLMKGTINGSLVTAAIVHQFSEYPAINFMDETDVSQDGAHVVIVGGDSSGTSPEKVFDFDFVHNVKGPVYTTLCTGSVSAPNNGCLHKLIQTPDNNVIIQFAGDGSGLEQGNRLWLGTSPLPALQNATNHLDAGYDKSGNAVYVEVGNTAVLPGLTNPCPSGWGLDVRMIYNLASAVCLLDHVPAWHVGYRGNAQQPWVGLSFFDSGRSPSPEWFDNTANYTAPTASTWSLYEDEVMVVRIDANNNSSLAYRLARAYSRSNEDFYAQPHAAISRDGKYIAFNSNMAYAHSGCPANFQSSTGCTDVYVIKIQ